MPRHAVFTIVQDDPVNLRIWARHYRRTYAAGDTFVLHHPRIGEPAYGADSWVADVAYDTAKGPILEGPEQAFGFEVVPVFREESFNHTWLRETVQAYQRFLLQSYDTVLFAEVDEIVAPHPIHSDFTLREFLDAFADTPPVCVRCDGYEVVHDFVCEPPIDYGKPLLPQRAYWYPSMQYSKPLLSKVPLIWVNGFHDGTGPAGRIAAPRIDLLLLHLHKLDFGHALDRHKRSAAQKWTKHDVDTRQGFQNQVADEAWLRDWWLNTVDSPGTRAKWERIPDVIKEIL